MTLPPDEVARVFGQQLKQLRVAAHWTQREIALACELSAAVIAKYEQATTRPLPETVAQIGQVLEARVPGAARRLALAWLVSAGGSAGADLNLLNVLLHWTELDEAAQQQVIEWAQVAGASDPKPPRGRPRKPPRAGPGRPRKLPTVMADLGIR